MAATARPALSGLGLIVVCFFALGRAEADRRRLGAGPGRRRGRRAADATGPAAGQDQLLEAIRQREAQLAAEEKRLADRKQTLGVAEAKLAEQLAAFEKAQKNLEKTLAMADQAAERDLARMTTVYENMKPADAAQIFETMDVSFAAGLLARMRPDVAARS